MWSTNLLIPFFGGISEIFFEIFDRLGCRRGIQVRKREEEQKLIPALLTRLVVCIFKVFDGFG